MLLYISRFNTPSSLCLIRFCQTEGPLGVPLVRLGRSGRFAPILVYNRRRNRVFTLVITMVGRIRIPGPAASGRGFVIVFLFIYQTFLVLCTGLRIWVPSIIGAPS